MAVTTGRDDDQREKENPMPGRSETADRDNNTLRAYKEMRRRILDNEMPPGSQYLEQELAELLGMSRTPVREALIRLTDEKLVEVRPRHGARVLPVTAADMRDIYEVLAELEGLAARQVAERGTTPEELAKLQAAYDEMERAIAKNDMKAWAAADFNFHNTIIDASRNSRLQDVIRVFIDQSHRARMQVLQHRPLPRDSNVEHATLLKALRERNAAAAQKIHHDHRARIGKVMVELLQQIERPS